LVPWREAPEIEEGDASKMKLKLVCIVIVCASVLACPFRSSAQGRDVSDIVPPQVSYATGFVQRLSDGGLWIQRSRFRNTTVATLADESSLGENG
jgi:hypothetical protein